jgi:hypothetical protein
MLASFLARQWQAGVGTDAPGETLPSWRPACKHRTHGTHPQHEAPDFLHILFMLLLIFYQEAAMLPSKQFISIHFVF